MQDQSTWHIVINSKRNLLHVRFTGRNSHRFEAIQLPMRLTFKPGRWRVGWQHVKVGEAWHMDPLYDLAARLMELLEAGALHDVLEVDEKEFEDTAGTASAAKSTKAKRHRKAAKKFEAPAYRHDLGSFGGSQSSAGLGYGYDSDSWSNPYRDQDWTACYKDCGWCGHCIDGIDI